MALIMILYITIHYMIIKIFVTDDEAPIAALNFNYLFCFPITCVVVFGPILLVVIVGLLVLL